jgi:hypothetical protein
VSADLRDDHSAVVVAEVMPAALTLRIPAAPEETKL